MSNKRFGRTTLMCALVLAFSSNVNAEEIKVDSLRHAGGFAVPRPVMIDSTDVNSKKFDDGRLLDTPLRLDLIDTGELFIDSILPKSDTDALHLLGFTVSNTERTAVRISVKGLKQTQVFVDGEKVDAADCILNPSCHKVVVKCATRAGETDTVKVAVESKDGRTLKVSDIAGNAPRSYSIYDVLHATRFSSLSLSPDGRYMIYGKVETKAGGSTYTKRYVRETSTGKIVCQLPQYASWMPRSNKYYITDTNAADEKYMAVVDPRTGERTIIAENLPYGSFTISPTEDYLIYQLSDKGPAEDKGVYEVLTPEDRQPGWRNRNYLSKYDLKTGMMTRLTFGHHDTYLCDISSDGKRLLVMTSDSRLDARPTTVFSLFQLDLATMQLDTLVNRDGFINDAIFSPDGTAALIYGSPEALGGIGKNVREGQTPSMVDMQLYIMNLADKSVRPMTKHFNPSVKKYVWNDADGQIYFNAEDKDCVNLFRMNPKDGKIFRIALPEEMVKSFSVASAGKTMAFYGQSASNSDRLYTLDTKKLRPVLVEDLSAENLKNITLGECRAWTYINDKGDSICCRYYLPPHFDGKTRLPMVVNYYGGCMPTGRDFESRYPHHAYAAMGYAVLVINPSGAIGFGQEFSARHVNTAGEGVADDIIGATRAFCKEHSFINDKKIGCIGASYGGFMTMYLQTVTDLFTAAISHAGISDHTSYWGEGYWGYSYSEISMANSYPWTDKRLYVDQSPLFNADKVKTPLLFLHGAADNNVPVGESIQMYTALKLLGKETAMILVSDEDHHILDYHKRLKWQNTIYAWFSKWLKDDASWWNEIYKPKDL